MQRYGHFICSSLSRNISFTNTCRIRSSGGAALIKAFVDKENEFAHHVLANSQKPYQIFLLGEKELNFTDDQRWNVIPSFLSLTKEASDTITIELLLKQYEEIIRYCNTTKTSIADSRFREFIFMFCKRSHQLNDEQLLHTLRLLCQLDSQESVRTANFMELWNTLDMVCCGRIESWNHDQLLLVCDAWYSLHLARICDFVWEALRKLGRKVTRMSPEQLVQAMFFCNVVRKPVFEMFDFEVNLKKCSNEMSLKELGVMAMGFFKTETPIRNPELLEHLYRRLINEINTVEDITLVSLLKILRYSTKLAQVDLLMELLDELCGQVERISLLSCLHVALMGCDLQLCHDDVIERVLQRFNRDITQSRLKDLERVCLVIGLFNYTSKSGVAEELCDKILNTIRMRADEIVKYPRCFTNLLQFLTYKGYYDAEMISVVLEKRFIRHAFGSNMKLARSIFYLDSFVHINLQDSGYDGHRLGEKMRRTMGKLLTQYIPDRNKKFKLSATDQILLEIKETADIYFRPYTTIKHILPHFDRADIVICYDRKGKCALPLPTTLAEDYTGIILSHSDLVDPEYTNVQDVETIVIAIAGWNNVLRGKNTFSGPFEMKLKQLRLIGHKVIAIPWYEWREQETSQDRQRYLQRQLANVVNL